MRMGDYKLIEFFEDQHLELYNLKEDIGEVHNLVAEKPELAAEMRKKLKKWREDMGAKIPRKNQ